MFHYRSSTLVLALGCALLLSGCNPFDPITGVKWSSLQNQGQGGWVARNPGVRPPPSNSTALSSAKLRAIRKESKAQNQEKKEAFDRFQSTPEYQEYRRALREMYVNFHAEGAVVEGSDPNRISALIWRGTFAEGAVLAPAALSLPEDPLGVPDRRSQYGECLKDAEFRFGGTTDPGHNQASLTLHACDGDETWRWKAHEAEQRGRFVLGSTFVGTSYAPSRSHLFLTREGNRMYGAFFELWYRGRFVAWGGAGVEYRTSKSILELVLTPTEPAM